MMKAVLAVTLSACGSNEQPPPTASAAPASPQPIGAAPTLPPDAAALTLYTAAFAEFKGDRLLNCTSAAISVGTQPTGIPADLVAAMLADDMHASYRGGAGLIEDKAKLNEYLPKMLYPPPDQRKAVGAATEKVKKLVDASELKKRGVIKVDQCSFPNRTALALCEISSDGWSAMIAHFDVRTAADTDKDMKHCLTIGGKWSASAGADAALERARQHSNDLRSILAP